MSGGTPNRLSMGSQNVLVGCGGGVCLVLAFPGVLDEEENANLHTKIPIGCKGSGGTGSRGRKG